MTKKNRISKVNRQVLLVLALLKERGIKSVRVADVLRMVNKSRASDIAPNNFRSTCWRMKNELSYVNVVRDDSNNLWVGLTDRGVKAVEELNITGE